MAEYFIQGTSFAAPFVSDQIERYVTADSPEAALAAFVASKPHPCGVYAADAFPSADAMHKGQPSLARWLSNHARATQGASSIRSIAPGQLEIDGQLVSVDSPRAGRCG